MLVNLNAEKCLWKLLRHRLLVICITPASASDHQSQSGVAGHGLSPALTSFGYLAQGWTDWVSGLWLDCPWLAHRAIPFLLWKSLPCVGWCMVTLCNVHASYNVSWRIASGENNAYDTHTGPGNDNLGLFLRHQALLFSVHLLFVGCLSLD